MSGFSVVMLNGTAYQLKEMTYNDGLVISAIDKSFNERRISEFLRRVCDCDALQLSVQQRYFLLMNYLEQSTGLFAVELDFSRYYRKEEYRETVSDDTMTVRLLNGFEAEFLESKCKSIGEWIACAMALQIVHRDIEPLKMPIVATAPNFESEFMARLDYIKNLSLSDFDRLYSQYIALNEQFNALVDLSFGDDGFVVMGGTDDAPMRFCPSAAFTGLIKELDGYYFS